jgi:hypothetical protein
MEKPEASTDSCCWWTLGEGSCCEEPFQRAVSVKVDVDLVGAFPNWEQSSVLKMNEGVRNMLTVKIRLYLGWVALSSVISSTFTILSMSIPALRIRWKVAGSTNYQCDGKVEHRLEVHTSRKEFIRKGIAELRR